MKSTMLFTYMLCLLFSFNSGNELVLINRDTNTSGLTKIRVFEKGGITYARVWGACNPVNCDWGAIRVTPISKYHHYELIRANPDIAFLPLYSTLTYEQRHAKRTVQVEKHRTEDYYRIILETDYKDPSQKDKRNIFLFHKL